MLPRIPIGLKPRDSITLIFHDALPSWSPRSLDGRPGAGNGVGELLQPLDPLLVLTSRVQAEGVHGYVAVNAPCVHCVQELDAALFAKSNVASGFGPPEKRSPPLGQRPFSTIAGPSPRTARARRPSRPLPLAGHKAGEG